MKKVIFVFLIFCFSLTIISCGDDKEESTENPGTTTTTDDTTTSSGLYVAVGDSATILKSTDGITWTSVSATDSDNGSNSLSTGHTLNGVTYGNSTYVAVGTLSSTSSASILTSTDATAWTHRTSGTTNTLRGVTYAE